MLLCACSTRFLFRALNDREAAEKAIRLGLVDAGEPLKPRLTRREMAYVHFILEGRWDDWVAARFDVTTQRVQLLRKGVCEKLDIATPENVPE
jgi:hypothetical protein